MDYKIGTRGSKLALAQTGMVKERLECAYPDDTFEIVVIRTKGDKIQNVALDKIGDKGLFVKEIEQKLLDGEIDLAVHSMKDMPGENTPGLCFADAWACEDARDALILRVVSSIEELPKGAVIGTGSKRRAFQMKRLRPDVRCTGIRGNVDTRLRKMEDEKMDGIIMAAAGLKRLGLEEKISHIFSPDEMVPASAQGILAIQCREDDHGLQEKLNALSDPHARLRSSLERGFQRAMGGTCHIPVGSYCECTGEEIVFHCVYGEEDGSSLKCLHLRGTMSDQESLLAEAVELMKCSVGTVYLVGGGPGSVDLLTLRGKELLEQADCIVYDRLLEDAMLDFAPEGCERIYVGKASGNHTMKQDDINRLLVEKAKQHRTVVRLKGGDLYVFGRGGEEALFLREHGVPFEIVPGITSSVAGPAYAGIPITHRGIARGFRVVTAHDKDSELADIDFQSMAAGDETCVFLMGLSKAGEIADKLREAGKPETTPAAVISHATWATQKALYGTLADIKEKLDACPLPSPAIIVVGETAGLHDRLDFLEEKALRGCSVLLPRPGDRSELAEKLRKKGARVTELKTGDIVYHTERMEDIVYSDYEYLVCTSRHGAEAVLRNIREAKRDIRELAGVKIFCVGSATARVFEDHLIRIENLPEHYDGKSLAELLKGILTGEERILFVSGEMYNRELYDVLAHGGALRHVAVYENQVCDAKKPEALEEYDYVLFTCSSAAQACRDWLKPGQGPEVLSIGSVTAQTLAEMGFEDVRTARRATFDGCVQLLEEMWRKR